jgi:hypothetical protein
VLPALLAVLHQHGLRAVTLPQSIRTTTA